MDIVPIIISQYKAALSIIKKAVEKCPEGLWFDRTKGFPIWQLSYHALFFTDLYLQKGEKEFKAWKHHREHYQYFRCLPWDANIKVDAKQPYLRKELLEFIKKIFTRIEKNVPVLDMNEDSGFKWLPFSRLETHFYNIRHLEHHTGQIVDRLRNHGEVEIDWVAKG